MEGIDVERLAGIKWHWKRGEVVQMVSERGSFGI
jgi:hypothetical protein